jgi:predicted N-formylglutamate amidohydrolase
VLASHEGWDPGALQLARLLGRRLAAPVLVTHWSRLLVESNRSPTNPRIWSRFTRELPRAERERILERHWRPHREAVEAEIARAIARNGRVVHVAVHSFTPILDGEPRNADVALLYDSQRAPEKAFAQRWARALRADASGLRVRFNYPYRGCTDGLATWLRRRHPAARYTGFELEVNQALAAAPSWRNVGEALAASLGATLGRRPRQGRATRQRLTDSRTSASM